MKDIGCSIQSSLSLCWGWCSQTNIFQRHPINNYCHITVSFAVCFPCKYQLLNLAKFIKFIYIRDHLQNTFISKIYLYTVFAKSVFKVLLPHLGVTYRVILNQTVSMEVNKNIIWPLNALVLLLNTFTNSDWWNSRCYIKYIVCYFIWNLFMEDTRKLYCHFTAVQIQWK